MPRHSCCEVRVMQLHDILLLRTSASLHSVSVGAKPLSTGQCAPCRWLFYIIGNAIPYYDQGVKRSLTFDIYLYLENLTRYMKSYRYLVNSRMPRHSCCEVRIMQLHDILLLRTSASLHSVSVGAKPLSTGQCAPCRWLYQPGD